MQQLRSAIHNAIARFLKNQPPARIIAVGFALLILLGAALLMLPFAVHPGAHVAPLDALFTATSAVCVTGLVVVDTGDTFSLFGQAVIAILIQIGGLGVASIGMGLALVAGRRISLKGRSLVREALNVESLDGMVRLVRAVLLMTLVCEGAGAVLGFPAFARDHMPLHAVWLSIFHSVASFNNAGFDALGGVLTPDEEAQADSYASQLMEQNGDLYKANGIGLDTLKRFERILIKSSDLLTLCYGTDGETPVSDAELTSHLEDDMVYIRYTVIPLYNTSTFAFADDDQSTQMLELAQTAAESYNAAVHADAAAQTSAFGAAVSAALPDIYAVLDGTPSSDAASLSTALLGAADIDSTFSEEGAADVVRALKPGEAAAVQYSGYALMLLVRLDPLEADTLDALRAQALSDMKSSELQDSIQSFGASLPHALDTAAMKKLPASKIKNTQNDQ